MISVLPKEWLRKAYVSFTCRRVNLDDAVKIIREPYQPKTGDVVLARIKEVGQHKRVELANGRKSSLCIDDIVLLAFGNRYATDQFEGLVPNNLSHCNMVAAGGIAAMAACKNLRMDDATVIQPVGVLADASGSPINLHRYRVENSSRDQDLPPVIAVCGTSMNAGKTHTAASLIRGLSRAGFKVGATKLTGTGSGGDIWRMRDSGAAKVVDFTDAGYASTYMLPFDTLMEITDHLFDALAAKNVDVIVAEIADGLSHFETRDMLQDETFLQKLHGCLFAAGDAMNGVIGNQWLREWNVPLTAISGLVTTSPLSNRELCGLVETPVVSAEQLSSPEELKYLLEDLFAKKNSPKQPQEQPDNVVPAYLVSGEFPALKNTSMLENIAAKRA